VSLVARERQNFDPAGHYSRADIFRVEVDRLAERLRTTSTDAAAGEERTGPLRRVLGPIPDGKRADPDVA